MHDVSRRSFLRTTTAAGLAALPSARELTAADGRRAWISSDDDPLGIRGEFPVTEELAYLNSASVGPLPRAVRDALAAYADEKMRHRNPGSRRTARESARRKFADLFGADEDEIALLFATSDGENVVTSAMDWNEGDNVVLDELHFTTSFVLYRELERRFGVELRIVAPVEGRARIEDFEARTDDRTRLISVAWVSNRNGYRYDVRTLSELAHAHDAYLFADAIQAWGSFPANLHEEGVDFACGNSYKWLFADFGCAPLYVRREHLEWMRPDRYGHAHVAESLPDHRFRLKTSAAKFEYANVSYGSATALDAALSVLEDVGLDRIEAHTVALAGRVREGVVDLGMRPFTPPDNASSIVSFYHGLDVDALWDALSEEGVPVTFQEDGALLRTGVALFNNQSDVDRLLGVLARLA
ncbi:MAG: aminotransferase class V-fold PLP-dependent enzyme [Gemmatimonadetes bacterium]|nr:aminotransferase class V-fold PLP-dependent enzyme [Gemmatimonadota bacterium]